MRVALVLASALVWVGGACAEQAHKPAERLGDVNFPTSCSESVQAGMTRGVALLHSFGYAEAKMQFGEVAKADPGCAMAHWGLAMTDYQELWGTPSREDIAAGEAEMSQARALAAKSGAVTPREQAYIDAMSAYFQPGEMTTQRRADAYEAKMNALRAAFPQDVEGAAFDALAILAATPHGDTSLKHQHQALAILLPLFKQHPGHPGLAHYIIHTCDTPALAQQGLQAAEVYARIAPSSPHALHMPGHIFARLGMWPQDVAVNLASQAASKRDYAEGKPGAAHQLHADEFLVYAYLQMGDDEKARMLASEMRGVGDQMAATKYPDDMKDMGPYADNEVNAIYLLEMHQWKQMAALQPAPGSGAEDELDTFWGRGVAAGHLKDAKLAGSALERFESDVKKLPKMEQTSGYVAIKRDEMAGWQAFAQGHDEAAVGLMRKAADRQDKLGQGEVDIPAREMLGDLLLMENKPAAALAEYKVALKLSPNRLNGLLGAGRAAEQAGRMEEARAYDRAVAKQTDDAKESQRPELVRAVKRVETEAPINTVMLR